MKSPTYYRLLIVATSLLAASQLFARPIGFSELSLLVRMHEPETSIKNEVADRKLLHGLTQPQEGILKSQGASDSLIRSLCNPNLVVSKEEAVAVESAAARESSASAAEMHPAGHHRHVLVFNIAFGHPINLSQWGGLDYEIAFYSYRFAGEDHIQPAFVDPIGTRTEVSRIIPLHGLGESETFSQSWFPTNAVRSWRFTPYDSTADMRDHRFNFSDSVAVSSYSVSRPTRIDWDNPVFIDGQAYTFYPVYGAG